MSFSFVKKQGEYSKKFWLMMIAFYALFVIRAIFRVDFPASIYLIWISLMALSFDDNEIVALVISFIPLHSGFQYKYAIFICIIVLLLKYSARFKINSIAVIVALVFVWELLHFDIGAPSLVELFRGFAELFFIAIIACLPKKKNIRVCQLFRVLAWSSAIAFVILLVLTVREHGSNIFDFMKGGFRLGALNVEEGAIALNYNPNGVGYICNLSIVGILISAYYRETNFADWLLFLFLIFVGLLTVSRTFILCLAVCLLLYVLLQKKSLRKKVLTFIAILVFAFAVFWVVDSYLVQILNNFGDRFDAEDVTNGRSFLFDFYNDFAFSSINNIVFGIGIQDIPGKVFEVSGVNVEVPHNGYQQLIVAWGVIGFISIICLIISLLYHAKKKCKKVSLLCYLHLFLLAVDALAGQFITSPSSILTLLLIYETVCYSSAYESLEVKNVEIV